MRTRADHIDDQDESGLNGFMGGSITTLPGVNRKVPKREFPIGFHVAAPGPSHEALDGPPAPRKRKAVGGPRGAPKGPPGAS